MSRVVRIARGCLLVAALLWAGCGGSARDTGVDGGYDGPASCAEARGCVVASLTGELRPTSTINTHREAQSFPLDDYSYA